MLFWKWKSCNQKELHMGQVLRTQSLEVNKYTVKILKIRTPEKFAVVTLKFKQDGFTVRVRTYYHDFYLVFA